MLLVHVDVKGRGRQQKKHRGGTRRNGAPQVGGPPAEKPDQRRCADDNRRRDTDVDLQDRDEERDQPQRDGLICELCPRGIHGLGQRSSLPSNAERIEPRSSSSSSTVQASNAASPSPALSITSAGSWRSTWVLMCCLLGAIGRRPPCSRMSDRLGSVSIETDPS